jgi:glycine cleavage system aminomethyltransferase T
MVDAAIAEDGRTVEVDIAGEVTKATLSRRALYDPSGARMRA